jgi:predicted nucleic acid-binding protein
VKCICCDTSFLFSVYTFDSQTSRAEACLSSLGQPLTLSSVNVFELENALRLAGWRKLYSPEAISAALAALDADCRSGRLIVAPLNFGDVLEEARRLSATHTLRHGYRGFDILHVAAALRLGAGQFVTFDMQQRRLAQAEGLKLNP